LNNSEITLDSLKAGSILLIDKPVKWTSFDVVNYIRKSIDVKIGHAGTLDPLATGLLILCTGKLTKQIDNYQGMEKEYTGTIILGQTTPSFDLETEISDSKDSSSISDIEIRDVANQMIGVQNQIAPSYSAKKIDGERAYHKARRGEDVEIKAREIEIIEFEIIEIFRKNEVINVNFRVVCSKGTYIRGIARDFGLKLNNMAYLSNLIRTKIGQFNLSDALTLDAFKILFPVPFKYKQN
jgi:tRNA pseudouridine55 synthase